MGRTYIKVNTIAPGYMKTELTRRFFENGGEMTDTWMNMTPMGRPGQPEELGGIALYLAIRCFFCCYRVDIFH